MLMVCSDSSQLLDGVLLVTFGGPERSEDVMDFLKNVTAGRGIPQRRLEAVAENYRRHGGSPINAQSRDLLQALQAELEDRGSDLRLYWGARNWHPYLSDTLVQMKQDGVSRVAALITSVASSYSGCRQYRENLDEAAHKAEAEDIEFLKLPVLGDLSGFVDTMGENLSASLKVVTETLALADQHRFGGHSSSVESTPASVKTAAGKRAEGTVAVLYSAHSIPLAMAETSEYVEQLSQIVDELNSRCGVQGRLVWQSRSGPPHMPWLEPDVADAISQLDESVGAVVVVPIGFISDHMEVIEDLDTLAKQAAVEKGLVFERVPTVGCDHRFITSLVDLILEYQGRAPAERALDFAPLSQCSPECCAYRPAHSGA